MWIFTSAGFVSAVEHREDANKLMVRGRDNESLTTMLWGIEAAGKAADEDYGVKDMTIYSESYSDYPWRVVVSKATFAIWIQFEILNYLNYHNFKNALTEVRGEVWHKAAMNVWADMLKVEDKPKGWQPFKGMTDAEYADIWATEDTIRNEYMAAEHAAVLADAEEFGYDDYEEDGDIRSALIQMSIDRLHEVEKGPKGEQYVPQPPAVLEYELVEVTSDDEISAGTTSTLVRPKAIEGGKGSEDVY